MSSCHGTSKRIDTLFWGGLLLIVLGIAAHVFSPRALPQSGATFSHHLTELMLKMSWGIVAGILAVGVLDIIPRQFIFAVIGKGGSFKGILRAVGLGLLLDLCSHGILLVGLKLYERGASLGQTMAFLIASPWNSISLTFVLIGLIGWKWTLVFILLSALIALISGVLFDVLEDKALLPGKNRQKSQALEQDAEKTLSEVFADAKAQPWKTTKTIAINGFKGSRMILRWLFLGAILAAILKTFVPQDFLSQYFGPSLLGLMMTIVATTILEVCSEGSSPIAADLLTRAKAPGNAFAFLMAGVSTDYTEIMGIREQTQSWKVAFALPLITLPQVIVLGLLLNA